MPLVSGVRFANVDGKKIYMVFVIVIKLYDVANLATERGSSKAAENKDQRSASGLFAKVEARGSIECHQLGIRSLVPDFQVAAMHMRKRIADHVEHILRSAGHDAKPCIRADHEDEYGNSEPFEPTVHGVFGLMGIRAKLIAERFVTREGFFDEVHRGVGRLNVLDLHLLAFELLVILEKTLQY